MSLHVPERLLDGAQRQSWRAFITVMQLHENRPIKRAGVAGIALRADLKNLEIFRKKFRIF